MGTNYYAVSRKLSLHRDVFHIGKASAGWKFCFRGYQDGNHSILSIADWKRVLKDYAILNEYDDEINYDDFFALVERLQKNENKDNFTTDVNVEGYRFHFNDFC